MFVKPIKISFTAASLFRNDCRCLTEVIEQLPLKTADSADCEINRLNGVGGAFLISNFTFSGKALLSNQKMAKLLL
jgi:hypothetical protein